MSTIEIVATDRFLSTFAMYCKFI